MAVKGIFASDRNIQATRKGDFAAALLRLEAVGSAPLLALTAGMDTADAKDTVVTWFEENRITGRINVTNNAASGTSFILDDSSIIVAGAIMMVESSGEYIYVDAVVGSTATVTRGYAGTTITAVDGSGTPVPIQRITTAHEEGSARPTAIANLGDPRFNLTQIVRNAWDVTGTARFVDYHTGDIVAKNRMDAASFHAEDIERALLWSRRSNGVLNGKPFRTMDGIISQITTNVTAQGSNTKASDINAFIRDIFARNIKGKPNERIAFVGNVVLGVINDLATINSISTINLDVGQEAYGMKITTWITPYGTIKLLTHPLMNESPLWTKQMYVLHPGALRTRYLRRTHEDNNDKDGSRAGVDADYGVITTELSVENRAEITSGVYTGIDTAAAG